jgi:formate dehydrogenase iron-sulfur subunit
MEENMSFGILFDTTLCIGCEACMDACHEAHNQPNTENYKLSSHNFTVVQNKTINDKDIYYRRLCMHCEDPTCVSVCPVGAFEKTKEGPVIYDASKCMGCRYCLMACPFDVPKYEWNKIFPPVKKCDMCYQRIKNGQKPHCTEVCPTEASLFGEKDNLICIAKQRIKETPENYYPYIYGLQEAGGTSVLFISSVSLDKIDFKIDNYQDAFPKFTWNVMKEIPNVISLGGVSLYGLWWIINRRMKLEKIRVHESEGLSKEEKV